MPPYVELIFSPPTPLKTFSFTTVLSTSPPTPARPPLVTCSVCSFWYLDCIYFSVSISSCHDLNAYKVETLLAVKPTQGNLTQESFTSKDKWVQLLLQTKNENISNVVDREGKPLVVWHGTNNAHVTNFDIEKVGQVHNRQNRSNMPRLP